MKSIDVDKEILNLAYYFFLLLIFVTVLFGLNFTGRQTKEVLRDFETLMLAIPIKAMEKNLELVHHLKRVRKGARLW